MRTDTHRNPTAMTTDVAKEGGLTLGVDYQVGDPFTVPGPSGPITLHTARLLLNPIELTIRAIDKASYYTHSGKQRWVYIAIPPKLWDQLTRDQKVSVIGFHYRHEGGTEMQNLFPVSF